MRVTSGASADEVYEALNARQRRRVDAVMRAREREEHEIKAAQNKPREAVRVALDAGVPARLLAARLGVSPARVYQMRDEALSFAEASEAARN